MSQGRPRATKAGGQGCSFPRTCGPLAGLPASRPVSQHRRPWMWLWTWFGGCGALWLEASGGQRKPRIPEEKPSRNTRGQGAAGSREGGAGERILLPAGPAAAEGWRPRSGPGGCGCVGGQRTWLKRVPPSVTNGPCPWGEKVTQCGGCPEDHVQEGECVFIHALMLFYEWSCPAYGHVVGGRNGG